MPEAPTRLLTRRSLEKSLLVASRKGHLATVRLLLEAGVNPDCLREDNFQTPLFMACKAEQVETVRLLCERAGVEMSRVDKDGNTPLLVAIKAHCLAVVNTLVMSGCNVNLVSTAVRRCCRY